MELGVQDTQPLLDELRQYEGETRERLEAILEAEATRQKAAARWPFAGGWHTESEIRRLRRRAWFRWIVVRVEAFMLIGFTLLLAVGVRGALTLFLPR